MASPSPTPSPPNSSSPSSPPPSQPPPSSSSDHHPNNLQLAFPISQQPPPTSQPPPPPNPRRLPPPCWSHEETAALIDAYRDKWYSLRRGNLKAPHWQEVADAVYRRCPAASPPKTAVQCRHKMEKLRKRYRTELQRASSIPVARFISSWVHFQRMEAMEKGPQMATAVAAPLTSPAPPSAQVRVRPHYSDDSNEDDDDDGGNYVDRGGDDDADGFGCDREYFGSRVRSNNGIGVGLNSRRVSGLYQNGIGNDSGSAGRSGGGFRIKIPTGVPVPQPGRNSGYKKTNKQFLGSSSGSGFGSGNGNNKGSGNYGSGFSVGNQVPRESRDLGLDMGRGGFGAKREREREKRRLRDPVEEMVGAIKVLGDGFVKMEQMKMEMAREIEASRMEMELKRTEMILDSQQRMVEAFAKAVWEKRKKAKRMPSPGV